MSVFEKQLEGAKRASTSHLLIKCARLINERAQTLWQAGGEAGPGTAQLALFPHIHLVEGTRVTELAAKLGISKQAVGQLVDDLERFGLVERVPDPVDRRAKRVCFTERGKMGMLEGLKLLRKIDRELKRELGAELMKALHGALGEVIAQVEPNLTGDN